MTLYSVTLFLLVYIHGHWFDKIWKKPPREDAYMNSGIGKCPKVKAFQRLLFIH